MELLSPSIVLAAYAEALLEGRRVVVFGDATSALPAEIVDRGARAVHVYDPEPARAALAAGTNRSKQISVVPLDEADIAVRDGAFDLAIVEDLSGAKEPAALLKRVRRALSQRGVAVIASPNPEAKLALVPRTSASRSSAALGYYELYDAVSAEFTEVRMLGQTPFVGYAIVDFAPEQEPDVSIDSGLVPGGAEEPEWFVALASRDAVECDAFGIVQLPAARVLGGGRRDVDAELAAELRAARANETRLVERVAALEAECQALKNPPKVTLIDPRLATLELELAKREGRIATLETEKSAADARARAALGELEGLRGKSLGGQKAETELSKLGTEKDRVDKQLHSLSAEKDALSKQLGAVSTEKDALSKQLGAVSTEKDALSKQLGAVSTEKDALSKQLGAVSAEKDALSKQLGPLSGEKQRLEQQLGLASAERVELTKQITRKDADLLKLSQAPAPSEEEEVSRLETALRERGDRIRQLEGNVRESERVGRELLRELGKKLVVGAPSPQPGPGASDPLVTQNARLIADLEAAGWTIQELEERLSRGAAPAR